MRILVAAIMAMLLLSPAWALAARKKAPAQTSTFTMTQAVEHALAANPTVESALKTLESARMNVGTAQSNFWPRVNLNWSSNRQKNYEEVQTYNSDNLSSFNWYKGLRVSYPLFAGFAHLNSLQKSLLGVEQEKARLRLAKLELTCNVQLQFLELLRARENLRSSRESIKRLETQLAAAEAFVAEDMAPYLNVLQNRTDLANARQALIRSQNDVRNAEVQLNRYLGLPKEARVNYVGKLTDIPAGAGMDEEEGIREALAHRPDLEVAQKSVQMAFKDMNIAMGQFLPRVDLTYDNMSASKDYDDGRYEGYTRNYWSAGISFTWEIFSGGQSTFSSLAEKKRAEALRKSYEDAVNQARAEVIGALLDLDAAKELIAASREGLKSAKEAYEMARTRYDTDTGTITELLDAQLRLTQAETEHSSALAQRGSARARLFRAVGRENHSLK